MGPAIFSDRLPTSLADLLSNTLILRQTLPYLSAAAVCNLSRASRALHRIVLQSPEAFRYLDLSSVKSAAVHSDGPLDHSSRQGAERIDTALTEDEFYSRPLRGIFAALDKVHLLRNVHTLVLDGLSVTAELVKELVTEEKYNVRILSIREAKHLNEWKLKQYLLYAIRPSRPAGVPRVKGIYMFSPRDPPSPPLSSKTRPSKFTPRGIMSSQGAQIGAAWNQKSTDALNAVLAPAEDRWYRASGRIIPKRPSADWADVIQACEGLIAFDAVLCRGPRHDPTKAYTKESGVVGVAHPTSFLRPAIATVALGPSGCETCHSCPEGAAVFGQSPQSHFPLLSPVPLHGSSLRAARIPHTTDGSAPPPLIARCEDCLKGRWCERCHKWWDEDCYAGSAVAQRTELQQTELTESLRTNGANHLISQQTIKVHMGLCVEACLVGEMEAGAGSNGMWG